ncbi:MAG: TIGR04063 family PEP-CTERM/XrtA system glycosyltransferase [Deltaproteobacteria bacterium]|jgi:PEP-CTERM/exosortase A-associated glycosyltransferase
MRVLHVLDHSLPLHSGYAFRTAAILREQRALGWETHHLTTPRHGSSSQPSETAGGLTFHRTPPPAGWRSRLPGAGRYLDEMHATEARLDELIDRIAPDVLHAHSPVLTALPALKIARKRHIPLVYEVRALWEDGAVDHGTTRAHSLRYRATRSLETYVLKRASQVTTICDGLGREIVSRGVRAERITVIPNAVDTSAFAFGVASDRELQARLGLQGSVVLGFIGSFYGYEGLDLLIDAFAELARARSDVRLVFVGGGPREEAMKVRAVQSGAADRIIFAGRVPHDDVQRYYSVIDLLVYPRLPVRVTELVTPLKPLEAMAQGRLLVASDVGGQRELVRDGETGFLFRAGSATALVERVNEVLASRDAWARIRAQARKYVETERTWRMSVARYGAVYDAALRNGSAYAG